MVTWPLQAAQQVADGPGHQAQAEAAEVFARLGGLGWPYEMLRQYLELAKAAVPQAGEGGPV